MKQNMPDRQRLEMIAEVALLYHEENHNLEEIGKLYGISPSTVSRLLKEAQELGIVEVVVRYPFLTVPAVGKKLANHFGLKAVYVLPDFKGTYTELIGKIGQLAARTLEKSLVDGMTLGISLGFAVASTARSFAVPEKKHCRVIRLQGANENEVAEGTDLAQIFSMQLGNEFKIIPSPWIMNSRNACELIMQEKSVRDVIHEAENASIALVGMGSMNPETSTLLRNKLLTLDELNSLRSAGAVGEICGKHFDDQGNQLDVDFNQRTVAINIERLRDINTVIGVAAGPNKVEAIMGAIRGKLINVLVTDSQVANLLLEQINKN